MQFANYKLANIKDNTQVVERLTKIENDISKDIGSDIVLIAYQKDEAAKV
jgi:hypothetical protein